LERVSGRDLPFWVCARRGTEPLFLPRFVPRSSYSNIVVIATTLSKRLMELAFLLALNSAVPPRSAGPYLGSCACKMDRGWTAECLQSAVRPVHAVGLGEHELHCGQSRHRAATPNRVRERVSMGQQEGRRHGKGGRPCGCCRAGDQRTRLCGMRSDGVWLVMSRCSAGVRWDAWQRRRR
jgi:hypothetical protein